MRVYRSRRVPRRASRRPRRASRRLNEWKGGVGPGNEKLSKFRKYLTDEIYQKIIPEYNKYSDHSNINSRLYEYCLELLKYYDINSAQPNDMLIESNEVTAQRIVDAAIGTVQEFDKAYKVLGLHDQATESEIKKAYKQQALKYHPDKQHSTEQERKKAQEKWNEMVQAYETLSNIDRAEIRKKKNEEIYTAIELVIKNYGIVALNEKGRVLNEVVTLIYKRLIEDITYTDTYVKLINKWPDQYSTVALKRPPSSMLQGQPEKVEVKNGEVVYRMGSVLKDEELVNYQSLEWLVKKHHCRKIPPLTNEELAFGIMSVLTNWNKSPSKPNGWYIYLRSDFLEYIVEKAKKHLATQQGMIDAIEKAINEKNLLKNDAQARMMRN